MKRNKLIEREARRLAKKQAAREEKEPFPRPRGVPFVVAKGIGTRGENMLTPFVKNWEIDQRGRHCARYAFERYEIVNVGWCPWCAQNNHPGVILRVRQFPHKTDVVIRLMCQTETRVMSARFVDKFTGEPTEELLALQFSAKKGKVG